MHQPFIPELSQDWTYPSTCVCNHVDAIRERVGSCVPYPTKDRMRQLMALAGELGDLVGYTPPMSRWEVVRTFKGKRRKRYERALASLKRKPIDLKSDSRVSSFVKVEPIKYDVNKVRPGNRMIQFFPYRYMLELSCYLKPAEHTLVATIGGGNFPDHRFIAKGLNQRDRALLVTEVYNSYNMCTVLELDASRFDAHVTEDLLDMEFSVWAKIADTRALELLKRQKVLRGRFSVGEAGGEYTCRGGRASGTPNTGSGNSIIMSVLLASFCAHLRDLGVPRATFICDGDDSLVFVEGALPPHLDIPAYFVDSGMTMKVDNITTTLSEIGFCQSKLVLLESGPMFIRDPKRVISRFLVSAGWGATDIFRVLFSTSQGELALNRGVPILQEFFVQARKWIRAWCPRGRLLERDLSRLGYRFENYLPPDWARAEPKEVSYSDRIAFARSFGISPTRQLELENKFRSLDAPPWKFIKGEGLDERWLFDGHRPDRWP